MGRIVALLASTVTLSLTVFLFSRSPAADTPLQVGFAEADITPQLGDKPVYMAGFGQNRKATAIHDPLKARVVVLKHGERKVALVSVDVVGLFHASAERVRESLPGFSYVLLSSTHNHEGPDTLGLWGPNPFKSGLDPDYLKQLEAKVVQAVKDADQSAVAATARIGTANAPELLHDGREPYIKHDELIVLEFTGVKSQQRAGLVVQWNCHPETLDSKNTEISSDFVGYTVKELQEKQRCPVVYLTGTVGGLLTSLHVPIQDADGKALADGTFAKTERFGRLVGQAAAKALEKAKPLSLGPIQVRSKEVYLPLENKSYVLGWQLGVLQRQAYLWTGDATKAEPAPAKEFKQPLCIRTEVAWLRLGELDIAAIPGEIYPELVLDKVQNPADPNADFADAPIEPAIYKQLAGPHRMIIGLANDEIGYILPKRQWDEKAPFCYGRQKAQYGEGNSVGPEAAPLLCRAFAEMMKK
jgi:hypothetical protein